MKRKNENAFTLVELIVVITILAILGTIAFISLQGYSKTSRDSVRISDVSNMKTSLELFHLNAGKYPLPDEYGTFTYGGNDLFYQGYFGDNVVQSVSRNMHEVPTDPLTDRKYIYSVGANKNELEILALLEGDGVASNTISQTNAAGITVTPKITGNYNGLFIKTISHIVPIPSIITSEEVLENIDYDLIQSRLESMVTNLGANIPEGQGNIVYNTGALTGLSFTGITITGITKDSSDADKAAIIEGIKSTYSGSSLKNDGIIDYILNLATDDATLAAAFDTTVLNETATVATVTSNSCDNSTKPADDLNKTYTVNPTSVNQTYVQDSNECGYTCTNSYTGTNCETAPNPYASCTGVNTPVIGVITTTDSYDSCNTNDIIVCSGNETGYTIAACNVGTNTAGTTSSSYGGLFQWGNHADFRGGQFTDGNVYPTVGTTQVSTISDYSTHSTSTFVKVADWTSLDSDGALRSASWNPCIGDYHVPTQTEWAGIHTAGGWGTNGLNMANDLKMPMAGYRYWSDAALRNQGIGGHYWSSSPSGTNGYYMRFYSTNIFPSDNGSRAYGFSVRCFKN